MRHPVGKGYFIWQLSLCGGGSPAKIAQMAKAARLSWVTIKTHNEISTRNGNILPFVQALRDVGVESWGWGYCKGNDPVGEAKIAAARTDEFGLAGYFIDAEVEYKAPGMAPKAKLFMANLIPLMHGKPVGLCAYRFPLLHAPFPFREFLDKCDFHAPQVYWVEAIRPDEPAVELARSISELRSIKDLPFVPIGVASPNDPGTWKPTIAQIDNFNQAATLRQLPGVGWWSWQHAENRQEVWDAIARHSWPTVVVTPTIPLVGLHGRADGRMQTADNNAVVLAKIEAVKLLTTAAPEDVDALRSIRPNMFIMVRMFEDFTGRVITPQQFAGWQMQAIKPFYDRGIRHFELHNEPNTNKEGLGSSWANGSGFATWFLSVRAIMKNVYPDILFGFPGLSPGGTIAGVRQDEQSFLGGALSAVLMSDWVGLHVYWDNTTEFVDALNGVSAKLYAARFPGKPLYITEFSNSSDVVDSASKGKEYVRFYQAAPNWQQVRASFSFVVSSSKGFEGEAWRKETGEQTANTIIVGNRGSTPSVDLPVTEVNDALQDVTQALGLLR